MDTNALPKYDRSDDPRNCCPRFNTDGWDDQELHFRDKLFVKAKVRSLFHIPINMGSVFARTFDEIEKADALDYDDLIILSYDPSSWSSEHYFAVSKDVPGQEMTQLTGDYITKIFEGPYKNAPKWEQEMKTLIESKGKRLIKTYFFYTTCPKCARYYGKNYVVAVSELK